MIASTIMTYYTGLDAAIRNKRAERIRLARTAAREKSLLMGSAGFKYVSGNKPGTGKWVHETGKTVPFAVYDKMNEAGLRQRLEFLVGFKEGTYYGRSNS